MGRIVVGTPAMERASIVPDHQVAGTPRVPIDELALRRVLHQVAQQQPSLRHRPTDDVRGMRTHVERLALRGGMDAHQQMPYCRQGGALRLVVVGEAELAARVEDGMLGYEI